MAKLVSPTIDKIFMGKLDHGCDLIKELTKIAEDNSITLGKIEAIGAVQKATLAYYDQDKKIYTTYTFDKHLEIISLVGNISIKDGKPLIHAHLNLSDSDGVSYGGHLMPDTIIFACEVIIQKYTGASLVRGFDEVTGLPLWEM